MRNQIRTAAALALLASAALNAQADAITEWNMKAGEVIAEARMGTPPAVRVMAFVQTAAFEAANAVTGRYPGSLVKAEAGSGAQADAAVAAASRAALLKMLPAQEATINAAYQAALAKLPEAGRAAGVAVGEKAAAAVFAARADDAAIGPEQYRPATTVGTYVPTALPAVPQWPQRKPWLLARADQFRPAPPPALGSELWARDYNEVRTVGSRNSTLRTAGQTDVARFWDFSLPAIYYGVVRSVAEQPGRELTRNARLYAAVAQAMDDGLIAIMDAKYHYNFWRPISAIRNGDTDGNAATDRDASWVSLIDSPMHPEYPSAHSILASSVGVLIKAEVGSGTLPVLATSSPTAKGATRSWTKVEDFTQEVAVSRIYGGIHYRVSTEVGSAMGRQLGELAVQKHLR